MKCASLSMVKAVDRRWEPNLKNAQKNKMGIENGNAYNILSASFNKRTDFLWKRKKSFEMIKLLGGQHVSPFAFFSV